MRAAAPWVLLGAATAAVALTLEAAGMPSPTLFAALLAGLAVALAGRAGSLDVPRPAFVAGQAVVGVALGAYLQSSSLKAIAHSWLPVTLVSAGTLALSLGAGVAIARVTSLDMATATLGMVAGGASGIVTMAGDLGADDRLVAFMQYLRVLVVVVLTPLLIALAGVHAGGAGAGPSPPAFGTLRGWLLTAVIAPLGAVLARRARFPAGALLGPMILAGALTLAGVAFAVPPAAQQVAYALIGLQVGLRFTLETVRRLGRLLLPVLAGLFGLLAGCFGLAVVLHLTAPVSLRDAYLATTPGGLYAVLAIAFGANANTTFILAVQGLRLLVMVLLAPLAVRRLAGAGTQPA
jgi:membrane AbrB-like protein